MTERTVTHATFVIERTYNCSPGRVFAARTEQRARELFDQLREVLEREATEA
jgi:uncharacterized protein YndB with AHSA1/START domain